MADDAVVTRHAQETITDEGEAGQTLTPGHFVVEDPTASGEYIPAPAGEAAPPTVVGLPFDPNDDKADGQGDGERVRLHYCPPGVEVDAIAGAAIDISTEALLKHDGSGQLIPLDTGGGDTYGQAVAYGLEDASGSGDRVEVRVL
jgi:hypothetical protein